METVYEDPRFIALNNSEYSILNFTFNIKLTIKPLLLFLQAFRLQIK